MKENATFAPVVCMIGADSLKLDSSNKLLSLLPRQLEDRLYSQVVRWHDEFVP